MTAAQLVHLAELSVLAADYFAVSDPETAQLFHAAGLCASTLSAELHHDEAKHTTEGAIFLGGAVILLGIVVTLVRREL